MLARVLFSFLETSGTHTLFFLIIRRFLLVAMHLNATTKFLPSSSFFLIDSRKELKSRWEMEIIKCIIQAQSGDVAVHSFYFNTWLFDLKLFSAVPRFSMSTYQPK